MICPMCDTTPSVHVSLLVSLHVSLHVTLMCQGIISLFTQDIDL